MTTPDLRVALVGPGEIGEIHAGVLRELHVSIFAVVGPDDQSVAGLGDEYGVERRYRSLEELLAHDEVDAVIIAAPPAVHARLSMLALSAGANVLCEIPAALSYSEAEEVARCAARTGRVAVVAHTLRYFSSYQRLMELIKGMARQPTQIVSRSLGRRHENVGWTGRSRDWTDSVLWHNGAHAVDAVLWALGEDDVSVMGVCGPIWPGTGTSMDVAAVLVAPDGRLASIALSYHSKVAVNELLVICEDDTFVVEGGRLSSSAGLLFDGGDPTYSLRAAIVEQDRDFISAITHGTAPQFSVRDSLATMRVLDQLATVPVDGGTEISTPPYLKPTPL